MKRFGAAAGALLLALPSGAAPKKPTPIAIARIAYVEDLVERQPQGDSWKRATEGSALFIGDRLRTGPVAGARVDYPWMSVTLSPGSEISVPSSLVLATVLEQGRVEQAAPAGETIKLVTAEARVRGAGHVVVRREKGQTSVSVLEGTFRVEVGDKQLALAAGQGTIVRAGSAPLVVSTLPGQPEDLDPGDDPRYATPNEPIQLCFRSVELMHHVQIVDLTGGNVLLERDVALAPIEIKVPWQGTFRWRVSARDANGLEGRPSPDGFIAVVAR